MPIVDVIVAVVVGNLVAVWDGESFRGVVLVMDWFERDAVVDFRKLDQGLASGLRLAGGPTFPIQLHWQPENGST
jgi:hypothetical protein